MFIFNGVIFCILLFVPIATLLVEGYNGSV